MSIRSRSAAEVEQIVLTQFSEVFGESSRGRKAYQSQDRRGSENCDFNKLQEIPFENAVVLNVIRGDTPRSQTSQRESKVNKDEISKCFLEIQENFGLLKNKNLTSGENVTEDHVSKMMTLVKGKLDVFQKEKKVQFHDEVWIVALQATFYQCNNIFLEMQERFNKENDPLKAFEKLKNSFRDIFIGLFEAKSVATAVLSHCKTAPV